MASRFRFSLKSLVAVVSLAAVLFGWWSDHRRLRRRIEELQENRVPELQMVIESGEMLDPSLPPTGVIRSQGRDVGASDQADEDTESSDR